MLAEGATAAAVHDKVALDLLTHDPSLQNPNLPNARHYDGMHNDDAG